MTHPESCPRQFEVEAVRDGRLAGAARDALALHVQSCAGCRAHASALDELARRLAGDLPPDDVITARRQRHRLLAAFDRELDQLPRSPRLRAARAAVAAVAATAAVVAVVAVATRDGERAEVEVAAPAARISPVTVVADGAAWSRVDDGATTEVRLDDGTADIRVDHRDGWHRLVVKLPDGQLDDLGTTFRVRVDRGVTVAVTVYDGAVVLRRAGHKPIALSAGDSWRVEDAGPTAPPAPVAATADAPTAGPPPSTPAPAAADGARSRSPAPAIARHGELPGRGRDDGSAAPVTPAAPATPATIDSPPSRAPGDDATTIAHELGDAVSLLDAGRFASAVAALRAFIARHGDDARVEDASYLLVLALQRASEPVAMRAAALDYLRRYPRGFRRRLIEALVR